MAYTVEQKQEFLAQVETMKAAMFAILQIDDGDIINEVGLDEYPFEESFDEVHARMYSWIEAITDDMENKTAKKGA